MSMQLRVLPTRLSMNKCSDQQIDFLPLVAPLPAPGVAEVRSDTPASDRRPAQKPFDMAAVGLPAHRPQGRHVLWHTEAEVKRRPPVVFPVILGERLARPRVVAIEELLDICFSGPRRRGQTNDALFKCHVPGLSPPPV